MTNFIKICFLWFWILGLSVAKADAAAVQELNQLLNNVKSFSADFIQTVQDARGNILQDSVGSMKVKRPHRFYWHVTAPFEQLVVSNGSVIWIYDPDLEQAIEQSLDAQVGSTPALLLSGEAGKITQEFEVSKIQTNSTVYFQLQPKEETVFAQMRVGFKSGKMVEMFLEDSLGQRTLIEFSGMRVNISLKDSMFTFVPPEGVDVIKEY